MTRERITDGLDVLVLLLANGGDVGVPPDGWESHEWAYVKGLASGAPHRAKIAHDANRTARIHQKYHLLKTIEATDEEKARGVVAKKIYVSKG